MKIVIDTKEDSPEEIKKAIRMLSSLVGGEVAGSQSDIFSDNSSNSPKDDSQGRGDMFNVFSSPGSENKAGESTKEGNKEKGNDYLEMPELEEYR